MTEKEIGKRLIELGGGTPPNDFMDIFNNIYEQNTTRGNNPFNSEGGNENKEKKDSGFTD